MENQFVNVEEDFILWDTVAIGANVPANINGWFPSFTELANSDVPISFFNQRQEGETGTVYTNMKKKTGLDWPVMVQSMGVRWIYPDPVNVDMFDGDRAAAKIFQNVLPDHMSIGLFVGGGDDKLLSLKPTFAPSGYGPQGNQSGPTASFSSAMTMGSPIAGNRWAWVERALPLPKDISIEVRLQLSTQGRDILRLLANVHPIVFSGGELTNWAMIEVTMRGTRQVQQRGEYHR